ncbi:hypothetical protein [Streptomyces sp. YIM 132580]|uniref:hypothetical protein n=1 Tax=Streptomyces sp. YIM 132580 TaxID=2691958 RepID=UPI001F4838B7|nr:hypothetical protein [Streptomyces sp. YIM 132580]
MAPSANGPGRRISGTRVVEGEGVDLTREEQTALLQRLAYRLIRNGLVEARQEEAVGLFGVLVHHAHEDQWDDVVQMAVGHARPDERVLLTSLLKRADAEPEHGHRLVLPAAGSLAHAPELAPGVRKEVERRTAGLLPPDGEENVRELARVGI